MPARLPDAGAVMAALARRYKAPEFALFEQCGNGTGFAGNRWADAIALGLWPSRGIDLTGFEIKVYRGDWLRELRNPAKAEDVATYCDFWYVVVPDLEIVKLAELPPPWGLMHATKRGVHVVKAAERRAPPAVLDRPMLAAMLRRASEGMIPVSSVSERLEQERRAGEQLGRDLAKIEHERTARELGQLRESVAAFEKRSGLSINAYNGARIGELVRTLELVSNERHAVMLRDVAIRLERAGVVVREAQESFERATATSPTDPRGGTIQAGDSEPA